MVGISNGQEQALRQVLTNYANDDNITTSETLTAILGVVGCDSERPTIRDQFAIAALQGDWAAQSEDSGGHFRRSADAEHLLPHAKLYYQMADAMLEARKS